MQLRTVREGKFDALRGANAEQGTAGAPNVINNAPFDGQSILHFQSIQYTLVSGRIPGHRRNQERHVHGGAELEPQRLDQGNQNFRF